MKELRLIQKNVNVLKKLYKEDISIPMKMSIIQQLNENLKFLKSELTAEEYEKKYTKLEDSINNVMEQLTNTNFLTELVRKVEAFLIKQGF